MGGWWSFMCIYEKKIKKVYVSLNDHCWPIYGRMMNFYVYLWKKIKKVSMSLTDHCWLLISLQRATQNVARHLYTVKGIWVCWIKIGWYPFHYYCLYCRPWYILKACKPDISDYWYNTDVQDVGLCDDGSIPNKVPYLRRVCGDNSAVLIQSILRSLYSIIVQFNTSSYYQQVILQLKSDSVFV